MPLSIQSSDVSAVHESILDAALELLLRFGYHKTTMADIADAAGMSAANLYRYFGNKKDIIAECAARCLDERIDLLGAIVDDRTLTATQKLERYALELIADSHALAGADSMVGELVDTITRERPDLLRSRNEIHFELLSRILSEGVEHGDFCAMDIRRTATYIFSAFTLFDVPLFVGFYTRSEFEERARGLVDVIVRGVSART